MRAAMLVALCAALGGAGCAAATDDAFARDAGPGDAAADAGGGAVRDAGSPDAGRPDAGLPDAGDGGGGGAGATGCRTDAVCAPQGRVCDQRTRSCVLPVDRCVGVTCEAGFVCRSGRCVQECDPDPCAVVTCAAAHRCDPRTGRCTREDLCALVTCDAGTACDSFTGACTALGGPPAPSHVGAACNLVTDCLAAGVEATCHSIRFRIFPDGYCTSFCEQGVPCPEGSVCGRVPGVSTRICLAHCHDTSECRPGYRCAVAAETAPDRVCLPPDVSSCADDVLGQTPCQRDGECARGTCDPDRLRCRCNPLGSRCNSTSDCTPGARCVSGPMGGLCEPVAGCDVVAGTGCPEGLACVPAPPGSIAAAGLETACLPPCDVDAARCRDGFVCTPARAPAPAGLAVCAPARCNADADCGTRCSCLTSAEACGPGRTCGPDGTCAPLACDAATALERCGDARACDLATGRCLAPRCDVPSGTCDFAPCRADADCGVGRVCAPETGRCALECDPAAPEPGACGSRGVCFDGRCERRCGRDGDCAASEVCDPSLERCVPRCGGATDCGPGASCDVEAGWCVRTCVPGDARCTGRTYCYGRRGTCTVACGDDADCAPGDYCHTSTGRCESVCAGDADCASVTGEVCHPTGRCEIPCDFHFQCRAEDGERCDPEARVCAPLVPPMR